LDFLPPARSFSAEGPLFLAGTALPNPYLMGQNPTERGLAARRQRGAYLHATPSFPFPIFIPPRLTPWSSTQTVIETWAKPYARGFRFPFLKRAIAFLPDPDQCRSASLKSFPRSLHHACVTKHFPPTMFSRSPCRKQPTFCFFSPLCPPLPFSIPPQLEDVCCLLR